MFFIANKNYFKGKSKAGFTMIEILVVISIVIILPTVIIANFPQIKHQFSLSRVTYKFAQDLRSAQNLAISSVHYEDSFGQSRDVTGYGVYVDINNFGNTRYVIYADQSPGDQQYQYGGGDYSVSDVDFSLTEPGVVIKQINNVFNNTASINFNPPNPDTTITALNQGANSVEVVFALSSDLANTRTVFVNTSGLIEVK
ncbi:MAG: hypothetical protein A3F47_00970 [Candidatus Staskawiczbacteria bacterium RIFCSPHIGHO2_12_FULL_38_11]|uniref:General secretion pathway GspH domain-containing protein n=1 Tax=Candidatus Staskawiczbacteria bacterium RIFCSPHIGHO2_12_FULL_38_11 TaxID=1802209 RepID=A0A1G2I482_9BACT|nr:MAG: hypothetical protein A3F47_00970 [Candidatus Staskawiczbacteria bacterium RIFCSPHIGHO2_12_FULL_38_11]